MKYDQEILTTSEIVGSSVGDRSQKFKKYDFAQGDTIQKRCTMLHGNCGYVMILSVLVLVSVGFKVLILK